MRLNHEAQAHWLYFYRPVDTKKFPFAVGTLEEFLLSSVSLTCCAKKPSTSLSERSQKIWLDVYLHSFCFSALRPRSGKASTFKIQVKLKLSEHPSGKSGRNCPLYLLCRCPMR